MLLWKFLQDLGRPLFKSVGGSLLVAIAASAAAHGANLPGSFNGNVYASHANVTAGPLATGLGSSAYLPCPCQGSGAKVISNTIGTLSVGAGGTVLHLGAAVDTTVSGKTPTTAEVTDASRITGLSLLGGLITADAVTAVANVSATASTISPSDNGTTFLNLKVAGTAIAANVSPNTVISLPGLGSVTLKKMSSSSTATTGSMKVEMISVAISAANSFGLPVGTTLVVGHALSGFSRVQPVVVVGGEAYGAIANAATGSTLQLKIGQPALVTIPCLGTNGKILTNNVNNTSVPGVLSLGASTTTAFGGATDTGQIAETTATVAGVNLLGGLIGASAITSVAEEAVKNGVTTRSTAGTSFAGLKIGLLVLPVDVPPNTTVALPLLGYVVVNEQVVPSRSSGKTVVNGLHVFITTANALGLPVGTEIVVAHADATAFPFPN